MATLTLPQDNSRIPQQPTTSSVANYTYPTDLTGSNRNMYVLFTLNQYVSDNVLAPATLAPYVNIALPVPLKINDQTTVNWEASSVVSTGAAAASSILSRFGKGASNIASMVSTTLGIANSLGNLYASITYNPFMVMLFKTQNFKEHVFQWIFAPNNQQDTDTLHNIIEYFKAAELPSYTNGFGGLLLNYPDILNVTFNVPDNEGTQQPYLFNFKPCAISSIFVDWSGGATPSFFKNGAPSIVTITMQLKEIELWFRTSPGQYS